MESIRPVFFFHFGSREVANGETRKLKRVRRREMLVMKICLPYNLLGFPKTYPIASMGLVYLPVDLDKCRYLYRTSHGCDGSGPIQRAGFLKEGLNPRHLQRSDPLKFTDSEETLSFFIARSQLRNSVGIRSQIQILMDWRQSQLMRLKLLKGR